MTTDAVPPFPPPPGAPQPEPPTPARYSSDERTMALLAHVLGIVVGFLAPLVIWLIKRTESPYVDHHGKEALNFQITVLLAATALSVVMCIPLVGLVAIPLLFALGIANIVFSILAAVKANDGELYRYPFTLRLVS